jgi:hypothetical protein
MYECIQSEEDEEAEEEKTNKRTNKARMRTYMCGLQVCFGVDEHLHCRAVTAARSHNERG